MAVESYGTLVGYYNETLKIGFIMWNGNSTAPTAGEKFFSLPAVYTPVQNAGTPIRNGDVLEVRLDGHAKVTLSTATWSQGTIMYPLK